MKRGGGPGAAALRPPLFGTTAPAVCGERRSGAAPNEVPKTASLVVCARMQQSARLLDVAAERTDAFSIMTTCGGNI